MNQKVAVVGTGRMGSALATALFNKGFATTVWNRTAAKTEALSGLGIQVAQSLPDAVERVDVVIVNINDYATTKQLLSGTAIESALRGKILVQLSSGSPDEAREMEAWARAHGIEYLDGAIVNYPSDIGKPQGTVLYSGSEELFGRVKLVLLAFGDNAIFVGKEVGHAAATDVALLTFITATMVGFLQGSIVCEAENLPVAGFLQSVRSLMPAMEAALSDLCDRIRMKEYGNPQASLETWSVAPRELIGWCKQHGIDHSFADPQLSLIERAIKAGRGQSDFAYLYEVLKRSAV